MDDSVKYRCAGKRRPQDPPQIVEANVPPQSTLNSKNPQARAKYQQNSRQISPHDLVVGRRNIPVETQHKGREIGRKDKTELRADHEEGSMVEQQLPVPSRNGVEELGRDLSHALPCIRDDK